MLLAASRNLTAMALSLALTASTVTATGFCPNALGAVQSTSSNPSWSNLEGEFICNTANDQRGSLLSSDVRRLYHAMNKRRNTTEACS